MRNPLIILSAVISFSLMWSIKCNAEVLAFIVNSYTNTISAIRTSTHTIGSTFNTGTQPVGIGITPDGSYLYVANSIDDTVSVIRTSDYATVSVINVGEEPYGVSVTPDGSHVYVTNRNDNTVSVIRSSDDTVTQTVTVGQEPYGVDVTPNGDFAYVVNRVDATLSVIDTATNVVTETISMSTKAPVKVVEISPDGKYAYVTAHEEVMVIRLSDNEVIDSIVVYRIGFANRPYDIAVTPDSRYLYVSYSGANTEDVSIISLPDNTYIRSIDIGYSSAMDITPDGSYVYVMHFADGKVSVLRTSDNKVVSTIGLSTGIILSGGITFGRFISDVPVVPDVVIPKAPSGLMAEDGTCWGIRLFWTDNSTSENGFKVERKYGSDGTYQEIRTISANATSYQDNDTSLEEATTYYYRIRSYNTAGDSAYSNEVSATTIEDEDSCGSGSSLGGTGCGFLGCDGSIGGCFIETTGN